MSEWRRAVRRELARYRAETGHDVVALRAFLDQSHDVFARAFPDNDHADAKVRQVLQQLRDRGELAFVDDGGTYQIGELGAHDGVSDAGGADGTDGEAPDYTADEYETTVGTRSMPAAFRDGVLNRYGHACPVSGVDHDALLDVAHVLSWSDHPERRTDPENVLVLDRTHHAAFDAGLFTLDADCRVRVAPDFETESALLRRTLVERRGERADVPDGALDPECLAAHNRALSWR